MDNQEHHITPYEQINLVCEYLNLGFMAEDIDYDSTIKNLYFDPEKWSNALIAAIVFFAEREQ